MTSKPVVVVVPRIRDSSLPRVRSGSPAQFTEMKLKSRCSIQFHFEVPGGSWQTVIVRPVSVANSYRSRFHRRPRDELLPPPSASNRRGRQPV